MKQDLDLEAIARRELSRLIDEIDVDAPLPMAEPRRTPWVHPILASAGLGLVAAGVIAVGALRREPPPAAEVDTAEPRTEEILWSSGPSPEDDTCPPDDMPDAVCHSVSYVSRDGQMVVSGAVWGIPPGPGSPDPEAIRLRYAVDGEVQELTMETTPGDQSGDVREWSAEVPEHVPPLVDPTTYHTLVDFFELTGLDRDGNMLWELRVIAP